MQIPVQGSEDPPHLSHGGARGAESGPRGANCLSPPRARATRRRSLASSLRALPSCSRRLFLSKELLSGGERGAARS